MDSKVPSEQRLLHWEQVRLQCTHIIDNFDVPIDEGIFDTVVALRVWGLATMQSCEGHLDYGLAAAWVDIGVSDTELIEHQAMELSERLRQAEESVQTSEQIATLFGGDRIISKRDIQKKLRRAGTVSRISGRILSATAYSNRSTTNPSSSSGMPRRYSGAGNLVRCSTFTKPWCITAKDSR